MSLQQIDSILAELTPSVMQLTTYSGASKLQMLRESPAMRQKYGVDIKTIVEINRRLKNELVKIPPQNLPQDVSY